MRSTLAILPTSRRISPMFDRLCRFAGFGVIALALGCLSLFAADDRIAQQKVTSSKVMTTPAKKESPAKPSTYKVMREPFKIEVSLKGVFEAAEMTEVVLRPQAWGVEGRGALTVLK